MLQLNKMSWSEKTGDEGIVVLGGSLSLHRVIKIHPEHLSEKAIVKRRIRLEMWHEIYGELTQPIRELEHYARSGAAINDLLEPPPESSAPPSNVRISDRL